MMSENNSQKKGDSTEEKMASSLKGSGGKSPSDGVHKMHERGGVGGHGEARHKVGVTVPGKAGLTTERVTTTLICSRTSRRGSSYLSPSQFRF